MVAVAPAGSPVAIIGKGLTPLDPGILQVLRASGRTESDEGRAEQYLRRQDGWALIQRDVPAVSVTSAFGDPDALDRFLASRYHQPADTPAGIELGGAADDLVLHVRRWSRWFRQHAALDRHRRKIGYRPLAAATAGRYMGRHATPGRKATLWHTTTSPSA